MSSAHSVHRSTVRAPRCGAAASGAPGVAVRMLTSGTTGPPKRIDLRYDMLERVLRGAKHYETGTGTDVRLRTGVVIVNSPLVHLGGLFRVLQAINDGRAFALLERFTRRRLDRRGARHRPKTVSLVPAALRMVLDADVDDDVFTSIRSVVSGTAPLDPDDADAFTAKLRRPGAHLVRRHRVRRRRRGLEPRRPRGVRGGQAGERRSRPRGCELRVVDADDGHDARLDEVGLLEVRAAQLGTDDWIRTTDLARIDADGFLWILGRADQAIIRGGFKVQPDDVRAALERSTAWPRRAVVGVPDERLGAVPVAAVERRPGAALDEAAVLAPSACTSPATRCRSR